MRRTLYDRMGIISKEGLLQGRERNSSEAYQNQSSERWIQGVLALAAILGFLGGTCFLYANLLGIPLYEVGDFAANSLLIQDAKSLSLLVGHYSRIGFNHPGPAILYTQALGEYVFYDLTHLVGSPFAGQLLSVGLFNGFWSAIFLVLTFRLTGSLVRAILFFSIFLLTSIHLDHHVIAGIWFPHLVFFPFSVFALSTAFLIIGRRDGLIPVVLSGSILVHGHVSFVAIVGIMTMGALGLNYITTGGPSRRASRILSIAFFKENSKILILSALIVFIFILPILAETFVNFPGEVPKYVGYSGGHRNGVIRTLDYVGSFWGGNAGTLLNCLVAAIILFIARSMLSVPDLRPMVSGVVGSILLSTVAFLIYAAFGIDDLSFQYVGTFYFAVPALLLAAFLLALLDKLSGSWRNIVFPVVIAGIVFDASGVLQRPIGYRPLYNDVRIPEMFEKVKALSTDNSGLLVLDLDATTDWGEVWSILLGIQAYSKRQHEDFFCFNRGWHISFTKEEKCTEQQISSGARYWVSAGPARNTPHFATNPIEIDNLKFYEFERPRIPAGSDIAVGEQSKDFFTTALEGGWSAVEGDFVWSLGGKSEILFRVNGSQTSEVVLDLAAFLPKPDFVQEAEISIDDAAPLAVQFTGESNRKKISLRLPPSARDGDETVSVKITVKRPISPKAAGMSRDPRVLGVALYGLNVN